MNYIQIPDYAFDTIIYLLKNGYDVCDNVDYDSEETEKTPQYANGYSRATMRDVIEKLNYYKEQAS